MARALRFGGGLSLALMLQWGALVRVANAQPVADDVVTGQGDGAEGSTSFRDLPSGLFIATSIDLGYQYARPRGTVGYGRPFDTFIGVDANPIVSPSAAGGYSGLRLATTGVDFRVGSKFYYAFRRSLLPIQDRYDRRDIEFNGGDPARYWSHEAELTLTPKIGPGKVISETAAAYLTRVDEDRYVFEESLRVVAAPPWVFRQRFGYLFPITDAGDLRLGIVAEMIRIPERDAWIARGGFLLRLQLFEELEVRANFVPVIASPDRIGLKGADFAQLGIRWRWAGPL